MSTLTATVPLTQHPTAADREAGLALINRVMSTFAKGMHAAPLTVLQHEAERLECQQPSPVVKAMRHIVEVELAAKRQAVA